METRLDLLLTYYKYPEPVRKVIRSTNMIERLNNEIRRKVKIIDSSPSEESARKIIYLRIIEENNKYSGNVFLN
jgi:transposase-like protein